MKKSLIAGLALGVVLVAGNAMAAQWNDNYGGNGIMNSSHDLSNGTFDIGATNEDSSQQRVCVYCHHPHNTIAAADIGNGYSPLWNRAMSTTSFVPYTNGNMMGNLDSSSIDHAMNGTPAFGGVSLLCMSCHDGVVAMSAFSQTGNSTGSSGGDTASNPITGSAAFTGTMSNHHPIGMNYSAVAAHDGEIADEGDTFYGNGVTIGDVMDNDGNMQCVSCHDVHNSLNDAGAERFLWTSNNRSAFCLVCHLKGDVSGTP